MSVVRQAKNISARASAICELPRTVTNQTVPQASARNQTMTCHYPAPACCLCPNCSDIPPYMYATVSGVTSRGECEDCPNLNTVHVLAPNPSAPCDWYSVGGIGCGNDDQHTCATYDLIEVTMGYDEETSRMRVTIQTSYGDPYGDYAWEKTMPRVIDCYQPVSFDSTDLIYSYGDPDCDFSNATIVVSGSDSKDCP